MRRAELHSLVLKMFGALTLLPKAGILGGHLPGVGDASSRAFSEQIDL